MKLPGKIALFEDQPLLERWGMRWMRKGSAQDKPINPEDPIHLLTPDERRAIRKVEKGAVIRAATAGAVTALIAALVELGLRTNEPENATLYWGGSARYWIVLGTVIGAVTVLEMLYLYWDSLRTVRRLSVLTGHTLFEHEEQAVVERALVRAALELPNSWQPIFGIDPQQEVSRWRVALIGFFYKLKVGLTNFLLRAFLRRAASRAALRSWIPFVAIPVTAAWNGLVSWWIMREARVRAFGPSAAVEFVQQKSLARMSEIGKAALVQGVALTIVKTRDRHPNVVLLLTLLINQLQAKKETTPAGEETFLRGLRGLPEEDASLVLEALLFAAILDGRCPKREREFIQDAFSARDRVLEPGAISKLKESFMRGDEIRSHGKRGNSSSVLGVSPQNTKSG